MEKMEQSQILGQFACMMGDVTTQIPINVGNWKPNVNQ